jgi:hypothetical protein
MRSDWGGSRQRSAVQIRPAQDTRTVAKAEAWHGQRTMIKAIVGDAADRCIAVATVVADAVGRDRRHAAGVPSGSRRRP